MPMAILVCAEFIKRVRAAFRGTAWNAGHAHGRRCIHTHQSLDRGMRAVANVRQQAVGDAATVRALYLVHCDLLVKIVHPHAALLTQHLLEQRFVVEFVPARQSYVERIQRLVCY